jgi:hypothetical protein
MQIAGGSFNKSTIRPNMLGKSNNNNDNYIYTEDDMTRIKSDNEKKIQKLKKAAEV